MDESSDVQARPGAIGSSPRTTWRRAVRTRLTVLVVAWLCWSTLTVVAFGYHVVGDATGVRSRTVAQAGPGIVRAILVGIAVLLSVEACSVTWRVVRHSSRIGVTGMVVAGLGCTAPLLFAFTPIGFVLLPVAALGIWLALPIGSAGPGVSTARPVAPPGWYPDPYPGGRFRYWDGTGWTPWTA